MILYTRQSPVQPSGRSVIDQSKPATMNPSTLQTLEVTSFLPASMAALMDAEQSCDPPPIYTHVISVYHPRIVSRRALRADNDGLHASGYGVRLYLLSFYKIFLNLVRVSLQHIPTCRITGLQHIPTCKSIVYIARRS